MLKVDRNVGHIAGDSDAALLQQSQLPRLRGRMVHFIDAESFIRIPVGEGVQSGTQQNVLRYAVRDAEGERIFSVTGSGNKKSPQGPGRIAFGRPHLVDVASQNADRERIAEYDRIIDRLVRRSTKSNAQRRSRWNRFLHARIDSRVTRIFINLLVDLYCSLTTLPSALLRTLATIARDAFHTRTLAQDDDRRALLVRVAKLNESSTPIAAKQPRTTYAALMLHTVAQRLSRPLQSEIRFEVLGSNVTPKMENAPLSLQEAKLALARTIGKLCEEDATAPDSTTRFGNHKAWMRWAYQHIDTNLRTFGV